MKHIKPVNEFFGFSKEEKAEKQRKLDIEQLKIELSKYNWLRMTAQPGKNKWDNEDLFELVKLRTHQGKQELPYLYKLLPELFELSENNTNAVRCFFRLNNNQTGKPQGESYEGIVPAKFSFIIDPYKRTVEDTPETKERALTYIMSKLKLN